MLSVEFAGNMGGAEMHDWYGSGGLCRDGFYAVGWRSSDPGGDDTIFILVRNEAAAINLVTELKKIMKS